MLLSGTGLALIVFGVRNGKAYDWGTIAGPVTVPQVIVTGVILLVALVLWQRYTRGRPLLPLAVFQDRNFSVSALVTASLGFSMTGMFLPLVIHLQTNLGLIPAQAGLLTVPMALLSATMGPFIGRLSDRVNAKYLVVAGLLGMAAGLALVATRTTSTAPSSALIPGLVVCGLGMGLVLVPLNNTAMRTVQPELRATASGVYFTARQLGAVLGSATTSLFLQSRTTAAVTAEARDAAGELPAPYPNRVHGHLSARAGDRTGINSGTGLSGLPTSLTAHADELAEHALRSGLAQGARAAYVPLIVALLLGVAAATTLRGSTRSRGSDA
ncbi:MFS transporter [Streptomyces sp. NPDC004539]|uniref:MFS transporter n=1 Tax=Streptomyces sp. NPDC004539 TaxID=3154280 RepID=UPI00339E0B1C